MRHFDIYVLFMHEFKEGCVMLTFSCRKLQLAMITREAITVVHTLTCSLGASRFENV